MPGVIGTAIYSKNVPLPERVVRVAVAAAIAVVAVVASSSVWLTAAGVATGLLIALTGFVGFCPACYLIGRRLVARKRTT